MASFNAMIFSFWNLLAVILVIFFFFISVKETIIESDRHVTVREVEKILKIPKSTIDLHIQRLGLVKKLDIWIPHELKEIHLMKRMNACDLHLKRNEFDPFFK